jgi:lipid II:glycine glycyltransferase (peptidoglycan interpeptide bridge formation enzyme)
MPEINTAEWENFLLAFPEAHLLQTSQWGELKSKYGWNCPSHYRSHSGQAEQSGAQILSVTAVDFLSLHPKGPVGQKSRGKSIAWQALWREIVPFAGIGGDISKS